MRLWEEEAPPLRGGLGLGAGMDGGCEAAGMEVGAEGTAADPFLASGSESTDGRATVLTGAAVLDNPPSRVVGPADERPHG